MTVATGSAADWEPTWENQLREARKLTDAELRQYAGVSLHNRHRCVDCFCCACVAVLEERKQEGRPG